MAEQGNALSPCDYYYSEKGKKRKEKKISYALTVKNSALDQLPVTEADYNSVLFCLGFFCFVLQSPSSCPSARPGNSRKRPEHARSVCDSRLTSRKCLALQSLTAETRQRARHFRKVHIRS